MARQVVVDMVQILPMVHQVVVVVGMVQFRLLPGTPLAVDMVVHRLRATAHRLRAMVAPQAVATVHRQAAVFMPEPLVRKIGS